MYRVRDFAEERSRTLYVRLPHTIRDPKEVKELFAGDAKVKLPRQSSRACHVIFPSLEEKVKGLKNLKGKTVDGKRVVAFDPRTKPTDEKMSKKKIFVPTPKPKDPANTTQMLLVSNIKSNTSAKELKKAFSGCVSIHFLKPDSDGLRSAFLKMKNVQTAAEYLRKEKEWPVVEGNQLSVGIGTGFSELKKKRKKSKPGAADGGMKIYDGDGKTDDNNFENLNSKGEENKESDPEPKSDSESQSEAETE